MRWARAVADRLFASPSAPAQQGLQDSQDPRGQPPDMATGREMKRIRIDRPRIRRERSWTEDPPTDPRDPDVVRAKALTRAGRRLSRASRAK